MNSCGVKHWILSGRGIALAAVGVFVFLLGYRTLTSVDLGYHLAYGEEFLKTGRVVDHNPFIFTLPPPDLPKDAQPDPGPGCWYDARGNYRFPNANWLSQLLMYGVYRFFGPFGLSMMSAVLHLLLMFMVWSLMARLKVSPTAGIPALLLLTLLFAPRMNLRPELMGYLMLCGQALLLASAFTDTTSRTPSLRLIGIMAILQILFVNLHSYFLLGIALAGAVCAGAIINYTSSLVRGTPDSTALRAAGGWALLVAVLTAVSFINPMTWRIAVLPIQTALYLREHAITEGPGPHPWSNIYELRPLLSKPNFPSSPRDYVFCLTLALAVSGSLAALIRRRWALLFAIAGMTSVGLSTTRNAPVGGLLVIPLALTAPAPLAFILSRSLSKAIRTRFNTAVMCLTAALAIAGSLSVVTQHYYDHVQKYKCRFGSGLSHKALPISTAEWLGRNLPGARVWCTFGTSSTLHFFSKPHCEISVLSNTWPYPPSLLQLDNLMRSGSVPVSVIFTNYGASVAVVRTEWSRPLFDALMKSPDWKPGYVDGDHTVFLRDEASSPARQLIERFYSADIALIIKEHRDRELVPGELLIPLGGTLAALSRLDDSISVLEAAVETAPESWEAWFALGEAYLARGWQWRDMRRIEDFKKARRSAERAVALNPKNPEAEKLLQRTNWLLTPTRPDSSGNHAGTHSGADL